MLYILIKVLTKVGLKQPDMLITLLQKVEKPLKPMFLGHNIKNNTAKRFAIPYLVGKVVLMRLIRADMLITFLLVQNP